MHRHQSLKQVENWQDRSFEIGGQAFPYHNVNVSHMLATLPGLPATVAPIDRSESGLPIGVEIIGPFLKDRTPITFAGLIERQFGGFVASPGYT